MPLLYAEFSLDSRTSQAPVRRLYAAYKQATAAALKASLGSILRKGDLVAAGAGGQWFIALLTARRPEHKARTSDADLGIAAERLRRALQRALVATRNELGDASALGRVAVRCGWNVLEPVDPDRPLEALRHAVRGAAVVARVEERRASVLAAVTHELRTPLTAIIGFAERLQESRVSASERKRYLAIIADESRRLHRLSEGLIDVGAWTAGSLRLRLQDCNLAAVAREAVRAVAERAKRKGVAIRISGNASATCDRDRCLQVFMNLLDNAVRHVPQRGRIEVNMKKSKRLCTVSVKDTGAGFEPSVRRSLGRPFASGTDGRAGLGLAVSKVLVEAHGGKLELGKGRGGGRVSITLPGAKARQ